MKTKEPATFLDALIDALQDAGRYNPDDQVAPAAILWPDEARQWTALLPVLRPRLPLLTLGDYDPAARTGPAAWLRCMIARTLPDDRLPDDALPIIYLPGIGKADLRAVESCPPELQPLVELQYRGTLWINRNGRDATVAGLLHALGAPVGTDNATRDALARALPHLAGESIERLQRAAPLRADFFNELVNPDPVRQMLQWLNDPDGYRDRLSDDEWAAFRALCRQKFGLDPVAAGPLTAAAKLGAPSGEWAPVWARYADAPTAYPNLPALLAQALPPTQLTLFEQRAAYNAHNPNDNALAEDELRGRLSALRDQTAAAAREAVAALEAEHGQRREWVWAALDRAPLAAALATLAELAARTAAPLPGTTTRQLAERYAADGWPVDAAVLAALAAVEAAADVEAVTCAVIPLYRPWLEQTAARFQGAVLADTGLDYPTGQPPAAAPGTCILFCDALRYDLGQQLAGRLSAAGHTTTVDWQLAALPPVTDTAKPAVSPAAGLVRGGDKPSLTPVARDTGTVLGTESLRGLIRGAGYQELRGDELGDPAGIAWAEFGAIDRYGHDHGWKIAHHAEAELNGLADRITALLNHGWQQVTVVTDHGWLLLPGDLPKAELPAHLTETRKGRCAVLKTGAATDYQTVPWHWNADVRIAVAPDIRCFEAGKVYEHGGLSLQECVVPVVAARRAGGAPGGVIIESITWAGLRANIQLSATGPDLVVDIRRAPGDTTTSVVSTPKPPDADGFVSLLVPDETLEGRELFVVVGRGGAIQAQQTTVVGGN